MDSANRMNLHNHTLFSDGSYEVKEIINAAERACGLDIVGICDHYRTKKVWEHSMDAQAISSYAEYVQQIYRATRYSVRVLVGLEIDFSPRTIDLETLPVEILNQVDFVLFEYVNSRIWGGFSCNKLITFREHFDIPVGIAHCNFNRDLWKGKKDSQILYDLAEAEIFLELAPGSRNRESTPSGFQPYYRLATDFFCEIRDKAIPLRFSIGTDTHEDISQVCEIDNALEFLDSYNLLNQLIRF